MSRGITWNQKPKISGAGRYREARAFQGTRWEGSYLMSIQLSLFDDRVVPFDEGLSRLRAILAVIAALEVGS